MKLLAFALLILLQGALAPGLHAQDLSYWVTFAPSDERFAVTMPQAPEGKKQKSSYGPLEVDGTAYSVKENEAVYTLWSLKNQNYAKSNLIDVEDYLDACAELVWESLFKPRREKLGLKGAQMMYEQALRAGGIPGRQYVLRFGARLGVVRFFADEDKIYVLNVYNASANEPGAMRFLTSFQPDREKAAQATDKDTDKDRQLLPVIGPGRGGNIQRDSSQGANNPSGPVDYNKVFTPKETTERARITTRPEPMYTEGARKFQVSGTVVLEAVLAKSGEITDVRVIRGLPHGLTRASLEAVKAIRFIPATRDGIPVSQRIVVEYNYNLY